MEVSDARSPEGARYDKARIEFEVVCLRFPAIERRINLIRSGLECNYNDVSKLATHIRAMEEGLETLAATKLQAKARLDASREQLDMRAHDEVAILLASMRLPVETAWQISECNNCVYSDEHYARAAMEELKWEKKEPDPDLVARNIIVDLTSKNGAGLFWTTNSWGHMEGRMVGYCILGD